MSGGANPKHSVDTTSFNLEAFVTSLASGHDDLGPRLRTVSVAPASARAQVLLHAHYFSFRGGKPTTEDFIDILVTKLVAFCLPRQEIRNAEKRWVNLTTQKKVEDAVRLHNRALDYLRKLPARPTETESSGRLSLIF